MLVFKTFYFVIEVFFFYSLIMFLLFGEFKGGGFMDSGPYHSYDSSFTHIGRSHFGSMCQTPSLKGGK